MAQLWNAWGTSWGLSWGTAWGRQETSNARSGWYKLLLSCIQEAALKDKSEEAVEIVPREKKVIFKLVEEFPTTEKKVTKKVTIEPETPPVRERPVLWRKESEQQADSFLPLAVVSMEFHRWAMQIEPLRLQMLAVKAANDEDEEEIELLLLAA